MGEGSQRKICAVQDLTLHTDTSTNLYIQNHKRSRQCVFLGHLELHHNRLRLTFTLGTLTLDSENRSTELIPSSHMLLNH